MNIQSSPILDTLARYRWGIGAVLGLVVLQQAAWLVEPTVFGHVLDAVVGHAAGKHPLEYLLKHLVVWLSVVGMNGLGGVARRFVGESVFTRLYSDFVLSLFHAGSARGDTPSRMAAQSEVSRELLTFLDTRAPDLVALVINVLGALIALYLIDYRIATACLSLTFPLALINRSVNRSTASLQTRVHDLRESTFDVFAVKDPARVRTHFDELGEAQRKVAWFGSINFGVMRAFLLGIFVAVLYIAIDLDHFSTGRRS